MKIFGNVLFLLIVNLMIFFISIKVFLDKL